eukprot:COSAG02_NODE_409_length_22892_cov_11.461150_12_plen_42_part_00
MHRIVPLSTVGVWECGSVAFEASTDGDRGARLRLADTDGTA